MKAPSHGLRLEIRRPEGTVEVLDVNVPRLIVGAGAHCDGRIFGYGASRAQVVLERVGSTLRARACHDGGSPPPMLGGRPLVQAELASGAELAAAGTRIRIEIVKRAPAAGVRRSKLLSSAGLALAIVALPGLVFAALRRPSEPGLAPAPREATALWDAAPATCRATAPDQARALGEKLRGVAELERERHPFAIGEGVAAVPTFAAAAACFERAGDAGQAAAMKRAGDALEARIQGDYLVHRVRLEHALDIGDDATALRETRVLRKLTQGRAGAYVDWLAMVERHLDGRATGAASGAG
jgi:hypothetical protein